MEAEAAAPFLCPPVVPTQRRGKDARTSNNHIYLCAHLFQPLQTHCTPKYWHPSWGKPLSHVYLPQPGSFAISCIWIQLRDAFACLDRRWDSPDACPVGSPLGFSFRALPLNRRPSAFWQSCLVDCAYSFRLLHIYRLAGLASSEHRILCSPATFSKNISERCILGRFPV